jgi:PAS domain S-box-containing protein
MTELVQAKMTILPQNAGPRVVAAERAREAFFSSLSDELRWSLDHEERFLVVAGAWQSVLGWRPERLHGWHWEEIVHPADRTRVAQAFARLRTGGGAERDIEVLIAQATGGHRLMRWTIVAGSGVDLFLGLGHDRAEMPAASSASRRALEVEAKVAELERRLEAMTRFAGMAAHQLAEPLVIAESSAILVLEELGETLDPMLRARLEAIGNGAARARRLMDALLEESRASAQPPELRSVDLADVVEETLATYQPRIEEQRARVQVAPMPSVLADRMLLSVILDNLVSNALKHGPRREGLVSIGAAPVDDGWRISVFSGGPPIATGDVPRILQPHVRLPGERRMSGSGLGLPICARLVARLGGSLGVEPGRAEGNTFWFVLPAAGVHPTP